MAMCNFGTVGCRRHRWQGVGAWNRSARYLLLSLIVVHMAPILGHTRLECPPPRSKKTGSKTGPCDAEDEPGLPPFPLNPGLNTVTWLESIGHPGAAGRFALSLDGTDDGFESCILLDHVPHDEHSRPKYSDETSYHRSSITLFIPDIKCERCHLQFLTFMTDDYHGVPKDTKCAYKYAQNAGTADASILTCSAVYHSCAPVSINGTVPRAEHTCSLPDHVQELGWPFMDGKPPASTYFFKGDPGLYDKKNARLLSGGSPVTGCSNPTHCSPENFYKKTLDVPARAKYVATHGSCASLVDMKVEPFKLGQLPSVPKAEKTADTTAPFGGSTHASGGTAAFSPSAMRWGSIPAAAAALAISLTADFRL